MPCQPLGSTPWLSALANEQPGLHLSHVGNLSRCDLHAAWSPTQSVQSQACSAGLAVALMLYNATNTITIKAHDHATRHHHNHSPELKIKIMTTDLCYRLHPMLAKSHPFIQEERFVIPSLLLLQSRVLSQLTSAFGLQHQNASLRASFQLLYQ